MTTTTHALDGRRIAITGAGRGLGAAYARLAASHGASVVVNDVDKDEIDKVVGAIRAAGGQAVGCQSDISTWEGAMAIVDQCRSSFGAIDGLINNAAVFWMEEPVRDDPVQFRRMIEINLLGTAYCGMAVAQAMIEQGRSGSILNTVSGAQSGSAGMAAYGASKGGVAALTYSWAIELEPQGIRVNAISPLAFTRTAQSIDPGLHADKPPEDVAPLAIYLLSDLCTVNGQVVFISGNEIALVSHPAVVHPSLQCGANSVAAIARLFEDDLAHRQLPLGRSRQRIETLLASDDFTVR